MKIEKLKDLTAKAFESLKKGHTSGFNRGPDFFQIVYLSQRKDKIQTTVLNLPDF